MNTKASGSQRGRSLFVKIGDTIENTPYKILNYQQKSESRDGMDVDVSVLTVENTLTKKNIDLVINKPANDPTSFGDFLYTYDNSKLRLKKDDEFTLTPEKDKKYKLIDISSSEAVIQDLGNNEKHKIPLLDQH